jgi:regulator of RNase E activity RraA
MDRMKMAQGRGFPVMLVAMAMALTVNAAFGVALTRVSTNGQRIYQAWINSAGDTMYADASGVMRKLCEKG